MMGDDVDGFLESGEVGYPRWIVGGGVKQTVIVPLDYFWLLFLQRDASVESSVH